jgi:hypothetical protein
MGILADWYALCTLSDLTTLVVGTIPYLAAFSLGAGRYLRKKHQEKLSAGYRYLVCQLLIDKPNFICQKEDVQWTERKTILLPFLFILAGVAAGFLGIGAGLVVGPIFLEMGIVPQVAVATSSYMILFTSFSTSVQFLILGTIHLCSKTLTLVTGRLPWEYALWYFFVGLIAAMIGQAGLSEIIRRYKKQAFITLLLATVIAVSVLLMGILEAIAIADNVKNHVPMGFRSICVAE